MLDSKGKNDKNGNFDWKDSAADAAIIAGLTFFTTLGATHVSGIPSVQACVASAIAAAGQFFLALAIKRGLREKPK